MLIQYKIYLSFLHLSLSYNTKLFNSTRIKVSSFSCLITIIESKYQGFIFLSVDNSIISLLVPNLLISMQTFESYIKIYSQDIKPFVFFIL